MKKLLLLCVSLCLVVAGCGGSSSGGKTVYLTVTPESDRLEADVVTDNSCTTGGGTFKTESIPIKLTSTAYSNANTKSSVTIDKVEISYKKYDPSSLAPELPTQYDTGMTILAGSTVTSNVKVAADKMKLDLVMNNGFNLCSADYWQYYATITFSGKEDYTNTPLSISTVVMVAFADRNNK